MREIDLQHGGKVTTGQYMTANPNFFLAAHGKGELGTTVLLTPKEAAKLADALTNGFISNIAGMIAPNDEMDVASLMEDLAIIKTAAQELLDS